MRQRVAQPAPLAERLRAERMVEQAAAIERQALEARLAKHVEAEVEAKAARDRDLQLERHEREREEVVREIAARVRPRPPERTHKESVRQQRQPEAFAGFGWRQGPVGQNKVGASPMMSPRFELVERNQRVQREQMDERFERLRARAQRTKVTELAALDRRYESRLRDVRVGVASKLARHRVAAQAVIAQAATRQSLARGPLSVSSDAALALAHESDASVGQLLGEYVIRLLSADWLLKRPAGFVLRKLPFLPTEAFLPPAEAQRCFEANRRCVAALSYANAQRGGHADPTGAQIGVVRSFLESAHGRGVQAIFVDWACLPLAPRTSAESEQLAAANRAMAKLYASPYGSVVLLMRGGDSLSSSGRSTAGNVSALPPPKVQRGWSVFEVAAAQLVVGHAARLEGGGGTSRVGAGVWSAVAPDEDGNAAAVGGIPGTGGGGGGAVICPKLVELSMGAGQVGSGQGSGVVGVEIRMSPSASAVKEALERASFGRELDRQMVQRLFADMCAEVEARATMRLTRGGGGGAGQRSRVAFNPGKPSGTRYLSEITRGVERSVLQRQEPPYTVR